MRIRDSIRLKILSVVLFCVFLIALTLGYLAFQFSKARIVTMLGDSAKGISNTIAGFTSSRVVSTILDNAGSLKAPVSKSAKEDTVPSGSFLMQDLEKESGLPGRLFTDPETVFENYTALLRNIKMRSDVNIAIYVYVISRNRLVAVASSEPVFFPGTSYEMRAEARKAAASGLVQATDIYKDKDGTWISAYAPGEYLSPKDKRRILVEIAYRPDPYIGILHKELVIIITICAIGFFIVAFISYHLVTALASSVIRLDEAVAEFERGRYDSPVDVTTSDEIGHLAAAFEKLRVSIRDKIDELKVSLARERKAHLESVVALTNAIEERDLYTKEHVSRVQHYALLIAKGMHLPHDQMMLLRYSCFLHDIGKIYIENALLKKGKLTHEDFEEIKKHSERGAKIIEGIEFLSEVKDAVLYHQERFDGKGYPRGLKGAEIPVLARIVSVADAFDAMTTDRPYKPKMSFGDAIKEIEKNSGTQFDPEVCAAFLKYRDTIEAMIGKR